MGMRLDDGRSFGYARQIGQVGERALASPPRFHLRYVKPSLRLLRHRGRMVHDIAAPFEEDTRSLCKQYVLLG